MVSRTTIYGYHGGYLKDSEDENYWIEVCRSREDAIRKAKNDWEDSKAMWNTLHENERESFWEYAVAITISDRTAEYLKAGFGDEWKEVALQSGADVLWEAPVKEWNDAYNKSNNRL